MKQIKSSLKSIEWSDERTLDVSNPYDNKVISRLGLASDHDVQKMLDIASGASIIKLPKTERISILEKASAIIESESLELCEMIVRESGKPLSFAKVEVERASENFKIAASFLRQSHDKVINTDSSSQGENKFAVWRPFSRGIVLGITPYNFPLNLVAHKVCPAIASASPIIIKPDLRTPETALKLNNILLRAGLPDAYYQTLYCENFLAEKLATSTEIKTLSFTGSSAVGWHLKSLCYDKPVLLELGGAATIIYDEKVNFESDIKKIAASAMAYSGQVCISTQNVLVRKDIYKDFEEKMKESLSSLKQGDPFCSDTIYGPLIDNKHKINILAKIDGLDKKSSLFSFGTDEANMLGARLINHFSHESDLLRREIFGPVLNLVKYESFEQALNMFNNFGSKLQGSLYSRDSDKVFKAHADLNTGALIQNSPPSFRLDHMPYGGNAESGFGREGIEYAFEEYCDRRLLVMQMKN